MRHDPRARAQAPHPEALRPRTPIPDRALRAAVAARPGIPPGPKRSGLGRRVPGASPRSRGGEGLLLPLTSR